MAPLYITFLHPADRGYLLLSCVILLRDTDGDHEPTPWRPCLPPQPIPARVIHLAHQLIDFGNQDRLEVSQLIEKAGDSKVNGLPTSH